MKLKNEAARRSRVVKVEYHPDYDHGAWSTFNEGGAEPTVESCPDAFFRVCSPAYPLHSVESTRRAPHRSLSRRALRKRLSRAGLRGRELNTTADQILAGPAGNGDHLGITRLGWNVEAFRKQFGRRITRASFRFVASSLVGNPRNDGWMFFLRHVRNLPSIAFPPPESSAYASSIPGSNEAAA